MLLIRVVIRRRIMEVFGEIFVGVRVAGGRRGGKWKELFCFILFLFFGFCFPAAFGGVCLKLARV